MKMFRLLLLLGILSLALGCSKKEAAVADSPPAPPAPATPTAPTAVIDDDLSYRNAPLDTETGAPAGQFEAPDPGDSEPVQRSFENAPPVIPHSVDGLLPITATENACADCHLPEAAADVGAVPVPASHLYDIRNDKQLTKLAGTNYNCTQCHAPQANADDLVENTFEPYYRAKERQASSNLLDTLNEGVETDK